MTINDHPWLGIDAIIRDDNGGILLLKRNKEKKIYPDMWSLPSGIVEWGEEVKDALAREVREETGLEVIESVFTGKYYDKTGRHPTKTIICLPHHCKVKGDMINLNKENSEYGWFSPEKIAKKKLAFDHKQILKDEGLI